MSKIEDALKRLNDCLIQVYVRGGTIVKIPAQKVELQEKNGIQDIKVIHSDITEE